LESAVRRSRRRRIVSAVFRTALLASLATALSVGCDSSQTPGTNLTMLALNPSVGRAVFHLRCAPTGGDLPDPSRACAALRQQPRLVTRPKPFVCAGGTFSWWDVTISGRLNGTTIRRSFATCWTPQMATIGRFGLSWDVLRKHLVARRHEGVLPGTRRVFPPGVLRAADLVTCDILGHHLEAGVPVGTGPEGRVSTGYGGANIVSVVLTVAHNRDGSVSASCHRGNA
jgi:hypothetical protein